MDLPSFLIVLHRLDADTIAAAAAELEDHASSAAGEVAWWRATVDIDRQLKARRAARLAARAATDAAAAVLAAAATAGLALPDHRVTVVARAAADVARGLVISATAVDDLLRDCSRLVAA